MQENQFKSPSPDYAIELLTYLPSRPGYETWIQTISAIGNTFSENQALYILSSHFQDEQKGETYSKLKNRLANVGFGTLVHLAKQNGYTTNTTAYKRPHNGFYNNYNPKHVPPKQKPYIQFNDDPNLTYRYHHGICERVYRIAINSLVLNKNLYPPTRQPYDNYTVLTNEFRNKCFSLNEIIESIGKGYSFLCCHLSANENGKTYRKKANFVQSELFAIDIDDGKTIEEAFQIEQTREALLIYTTASHTEQHNRFRIIFSMPRLITQPEHYEKIVSHYISLYGADRAAKDVARAFSGNDNASIYVIPTGEVLKFNQGVKNAV